MGKRPRSDEKNTMPDYDVQRLKNIASIALRVKEAGINSLLSKDLQEKVDRVSCNDGKSKEDKHESQDVVKLKSKKGLHQMNKTAQLSDIRPIPKIQSAALPNREYTSTKKSKKSLAQVFSVAEVLKAKTSKDPSIKTLRELQQDQTQHQLIKKPIAAENGEKQPPKACTSMFITPGSLAAYRNMRRMQENPHCELNKELDDHEIEEMSNEQNIEGDRISALEEDAENNQETNLDQEIVDENANTIPGVEKNKSRGRSILAHLHNRIAKEHQPIVLNERNQPVGPSKKVVDDLIHFLGTVAKDPILAPLNHASWKTVPNKDKIWDYVTKRFDVPEEGKKYVLKTVNDNWKLYKHRIKKATYDAFDTMNEMLDNRPKQVPETQFKYLLESWNSTTAQEISKKNSESAKCNLDYHTMGPCSYALKCDLLKQNHPDRKSPSQADLYIESRKRIPGRPYKTDHMPSLQNIEKMKEIQSLPGRIDNGDPYNEVITKKEHSGRVRLYGRTVTKTNLKEKECKSPFVLPQMYMDSIEEYLEKKILSKIMSQLQEANPGINLNLPNLTTTEDGDQSSKSSQNEDYQQVLEDDATN